MKAILAFIFLFNTLISFSQENTEVIEQPFIEVTGTANKEVIPDRIFIEIVLKEKTIDRKTYTIQEQETKLKSIVQSLNIGMGKLSLSDSNSEILFKRRREKGVILSKVYVLEVSNTEQVNSVFESLNNANIKEASITKTENSKIIEIRKEVRIEAIKAAKKKAQYLLEAIDEELGSPIEIKEQTQYNRVAQASINTLNTSNFSYYSESELDNLNFETIEVKFSYYIKYAIKVKK